MLAFAFLTSFLSSLFGKLVKLARKKISFCNTGITKIRNNIMNQTILRNKNWPNAIRKFLTYLTMVSNHQRSFEICVTISKVELVHNLSIVMKVNRTTDNYFCK